MSETRLVGRNLQGRTKGLAKTLFLALLVACATSAAATFEARAYEIDMTLTPDAVYIYQDVTVMVHVQTNSGTVTFGSDKSGTFHQYGSYLLTGSTVSVDSSGNCKVYYRPGANQSGITTLSATYNGDNAKTYEYLAVELRPTRTTVEFGAAYRAGIYVYQTATFATKVVDIAGSASVGVHPTGTISVSDATTKGGTSTVTLTGNSDTTIDGADAHKWDYSYEWTKLVAEGADYATVTASYTPSDGVHTASEGSSVVSVSRRPTAVAVTCTGSDTTAFYCSATVTEAAGVPGPGSAPAGPTGKLVLLNDASGSTKGSAPTATLAYLADPALSVFFPTVRYDPDNGVGVYMTSTGALTPPSGETWPEPCTRSVPSTPPGGGNTGANCTDGCGEGTIDVQTSILILNEECTALKAIQNACELATIITSLIPDPVWAAGFGVSSGSEIPVKEIINAIFEGTNLALEIAIQIMEADWDGDGLPNVVETTITHTDPELIDTDGDSMGDADEIFYNSGWMGGTLRPNPLIPDSDADGILDGNEGAVMYPTNVCLKDTDCDTIPDGAEVATLMDPTDDNSGFNPDTWTAIAAEYPYTFPFADPRDQSDPLQTDTDGDGLSDTIEFGPGALATLITDTNYHSYVNDDDSDDDGLQDGWEDADKDGRWDGPVTIASTGTNVTSGETHLCLADTDSDGLTDGEEEGLFGHGPRTVHSTLGTITIPALDDDSDDDGLSDYEEVVVTHTDPLNWDTDGDTISDANELVAVSGTYYQGRSFYQVSDPLDPNTDDDYLLDNQEYSGTGLSLVPNHGLGGTDDLVCPYVNHADSDNDGVQDGATISIQHAGPNGFIYSYTFVEGFADVEDSTDTPNTVRILVAPSSGELPADTICNVCDPDSDNDGLTDGQEIAIGTDPRNWDTDGDGRSDWSEVTGGGPIPTDPFDPDTDDDGLLDSAEVFGTNPTNPVSADTDGDGLCDGGAGTPYMLSHHATVTVNPICRSCSQPADVACASVRAGSADGIGDHPNPSGYGEDKNGNGAWDSGASYWTGAETDPNQFDTDGDGDGDGVEVLGFSTSRQSWIPSTDLFGRPITVVYPSCGCLDPLNPDTDGDRLEDGYEDRNHDGNFDFLPSEFDHPDSLLPGPPIPYPTETNPCDPDTDHDDLTDYEERYQSQVYVRYPDLTRSFNPTNPLDHDTDNDWLLDGYEVKYSCIALEYSTLDNDTDGRIDEDPIDGLDNDFDGRIDEDPVDFTMRFVPMLDPTNRDSDSDGFIDGLDENPCNSELIPLLWPAHGEPVDTDSDGFSDIDEVAAGTHPNDPTSHPAAFCKVDLDFDQLIDDRMWLERRPCCPEAAGVAIDLDNNLLVDLRLVIVPRSVKQGDFDGDGDKDDVRYVIEYSLSNYRALQPFVVATIDDYNTDLVIDWVMVERK